MLLLFVILLFALLFFIYDAVRKVNSSIMAQTDEIKKLRDVWEQKEK